MARIPLPSEFLQYLSNIGKRESDSSKLPSLKELSEELGVSVSRLREQLEVAKALKLVEVRPRTGMKWLPFTFSPAVWLSLSYAVELDRANFDEFLELRSHIEAAYWYEAVALLNPQDHQDLKNLIERAWEKLGSPQINIPHTEHRQLHMGFFRRLDNPFVIGILEAYWKAYEAVGLNRYTDYDYLKRVWQYHQQMVDAICEGDFIAGYQALVAHDEMLNKRPVSNLIDQQNNKNIHN